MKYKVDHYLTPNGKDPFQETLNGLWDNKARAYILRRIDRASEGNFGDHTNNLKDGVSELRINLGPGYRVYYSLFEGEMLILLLCAGDKSTQSKDIKRAIAYRTDYLEGILP